MMKEILVIRALKENLSQVTAFIGGHLEEIGCGMKLQIQLETAVEEIFINIASYAYPENPGNAVVELSCENERRSRLQIRVFRSTPFPAPTPTPPCLRRQDRSAVLGYSWSRK